MKNLGIIDYKKKGYDHAKHTTVEMRKLEKSLGNIDMRDLLHGMYHEQHLSLPQIAKAFDIPTCTTIQAWMIKSEIPRRTSLKFHASKAI